jgi:site-specific DNA recombinase
MSERKTVRCAIYTRKSSEDGLEQEFNSLEAQREACAAYIASQKGEGWKPLPTRYDDGGISGGHLDRPGLERLLGDIEAGKIDMVVVYKIDRLTRSLADFSRHVERFEARQCAFVSVTQAFNTSTSMGRLTLNVLLSFAQFEREVTAERIRDKIAASKKKGMWMGGQVPLGYRAKDRSLIIDPAEASLVKHIYRVYVKTRCLSEVEARLEREGHRTAKRTLKDGRVVGGRRFSRGHIHRILTSPLYAGKIAHKGEIHEGRHEAIIAEADWHRIQDLLQDQAVIRRRKPRGSPVKTAPRESSPLRGKLFDETGGRLTPSHTSIRGKRLRYYVSRKLVTRSVGAATEKERTDQSSVGTPTKTKGWRLPAIALESAVANAIAVHIKKLAGSARLLKKPTPAGLEAITAASQSLQDLLKQDRSGFIGALVLRVMIVPGQMTIDINRGGLAHQLGVGESEINEGVTTIRSAFQLRRRGIEAKIVTGLDPSEIDQVLAREVTRAITWRQEIEAGRSPNEIAKEMGWSTAPLRKRMKLAFLSPKLIAAILEGRQRADLSVNSLIHGEIPASWAEQERRFGD